MLTPRQERGRATPLFLAPLRDGMWIAGWQLHAFFVCSRTRAERCRALLRLAGGFHAFGNVTHFGLRNLT